MYIKFEKISFKNFLSTGDNPIEIELSKTFSTVITGRNGAGKSQFLDALSFVLFGKPQRNINKKQLVNSINNGGTEVEITFVRGDSTYRVHRGIKPDFLKIYKDGEQIDQEASVLDTQKKFETEILGMNRKVFSQVVILGSNTYVPFMLLSTPDRREVVEELLGLKIFTHMNDYIKKQISQEKAIGENLKTELLILQEKAKSANDMYEKVVRMGEESVQSKKATLMSEKEAIQVLINLFQEKDYDFKISDKEEKIQNLIPVKESVEKMIKDDRKIHQEYLLAIEKAGNKENFLETRGEAKVIQKSLDDLHKSLSEDHPSKEAMDKIRKDYETKINVLSQNINALIIGKGNIEARIKPIEEMIKFYTDDSNNLCSNCARPITPEEKAKYVGDNQSKKDELENRLKGMLADYRKKDDELTGMKGEAEVVISENDNKIKTDIFNSRVQIVTLKERLEMHFLRHKEHLTKEIKIKISEVEESIHLSEIAVSKFNKDEAETRNAIQEFLTTKSKEHAQIESKRGEIVRIESDIETAEKKVVEEKEGLLTKITETKNAVELSERVLDERRVDFKYLLAAQEILKDGGLKARIIEKYLPLMNSRINSYLQTMNFFVKFNINENFEEQILSRGRSEFSYESFSAGERARIDLAMLFTFLDVVCARNSSYTSLLLLDEVLDSSMDTAGLEGLESIMNSMDKNMKNVFVISHRGVEHENIFDRHLTVEKDGVFSEIKEV